MPKSRGRKKAMLKKQRANFDRQQHRTKVNDLVRMIEHLDKYEEQVLQPLVEDEDGNVLMTPEQARLVEDAQKMEEKNAR